MTYLNLVFPMPPALSSKILATTVAWAFALPISLGWSDDTESGERQPGLFATFMNQGSTVGRIDAELMFQWGRHPADSRLTGNLMPLDASWNGYLEIKEATTYQFHFYSVGEVVLRIGDREVLRSQSNRPSWSASEPFPLTIGFHKLEVRFRPNSANGQLGFFWSASTFELEPVPPNALSHFPNANDPTELFARGEQLYTALRCNACHKNPPPLPLKYGPALTRLSDNIHVEWLIDYLAMAPKPVTQLDKTHEGNDEPMRRRMPHLGISRAEAHRIAAALLADSEVSQAPTEFHVPIAKENKKGEPQARNRPDASEGKKLFFTVGCIACHQIDGVGNQSLFDGGELVNLMQKRTSNFTARWLENPDLANPDHRMPVFELTALERADLTLFLNGLTGPTQSKAVTELILDDPNLVSEGKALLQKYRCAACHRLPQSSESPADVKPLSRQSRWTGGCLSESPLAADIPYFELSKRDRSALRAFGQAFAEAGALSGRGQLELMQNNCFGCHGRGHEPGLFGLASDFIESEPDIASQLSTIVPPSLNGVGDKLREDVLASNITSKLPARRPWLKVRMPRFQFDDLALSEIVDHFVISDRVPDLARQPPKLPDDAALRLAVERLVTSDGFGCQSCHKIGSAEPALASINARGTHLTQLGQYIRPQWFRRWLKNPARIAPRTEMPAIQIPIRDVLQGDLERQIQALWETLNKPGFEPPKPNPVRVVRCTNQPGIEEQASILTDVLEIAGKPILRPLVIGLPNRHNLAYDLEAAAWRGWWIGDTARQYTRGKSWYWEPGASSLLEPNTMVERISLIDVAGNRWTPESTKQFAVQLDGLEHTLDGIRWFGRIEMQHAGSSSWITIQQSVQRQSDSESLVKTILSGLPDFPNLLIEAPVKIASTPSSWQAQLAEHAWATWRTEAPSQLATENTLQLSTRDGQVAWEVRIATDLPVDRFYAPAAELPRSSTSASDSSGGSHQAEATLFKAISLDCVPGFDAVQLPLPRSEMPTAFAWSPQGEMFMASLKGRVFHLHDTDDDGLEDKMIPVSDELPAPYGLYVNEDNSIDVLCKTSLIRIRNKGQSRYRQEVLADGWGYTADYHDWAVGLTKDRDGSYLIALPCQQDNRSPAAAHLRGTAVRLIPTADVPHRRFRAEVIAEGLRFPMGLALNREGDLFASDNQGNYNPFNELNHILVGKRYGFLNKLEVRPGYSPPFESPAINLPHPWTRSVNGICFLQRSPDGTSDSDSEFGPLAGDIVGCEYNGLSLIRMSLQKVNGQYQGAAYAMSRTVDPNQPTFEGPVSCAVSPNGDIYIGNMHDSGWGGGQNTGSIVRLRYNGHLPCGIDEVLATPTGFTIRFTRPVLVNLAQDAANYRIRAYHRISTPAYGGEDQDSKEMKVEEVHVHPDRMAVDLKLASRKEGYVYEFTVSSLAEGGNAMFPNQAHYHLRQVPAHSQ